MFPEYSGMSYEQASREAARLIETPGWFRSFERLTALREIMEHHIRLASDHEPSRASR